MALFGLVRPRTGTQTKPQSLGSGVANGIGSEASAMFKMLFQQVSQGSVPAGTYQTYRDMMQNPTLALAHAAATAPIIAAGYSIESDDDVPPEAVTLIQDVVAKLWADFAYQACRAIYYGWQGFEKVWDLDDERRMVIKRFKPLVPDKTEILIDKLTGELVGVRQGGVSLDLGYAMVLTYDKEGDDPYGRSRLENVRKWAYSPWIRGMDKLAQYQAKTAGVVPVVRYPEGSGVGAGGQTVPNYQAATAMLLQLQQAHGVAMPNSISDYMMDAVRAGANIGDSLAWQVDFLESAADHAAGFVASLSYEDKLMVRGYLIPERSILEGQFGTKAEAGVHGDIAVLISQQFLDYIVGQMNEQAVNDLLSVNFGPMLKDKVYLVANPIQDEQIALFTQIITSLYTSNPDMALAQLNFDSMLDSVGLPKSQEHIGLPMMGAPGMPGQVDANGLPMPQPPAYPQNPNNPPAMPQQPGFAKTLARAITDRLRARK